ncbi:oxidoreductase [Hanstruepera neustonica]|uniref:Oxidoreductase n=1 Tax=Hanstruepera neustonica TaxID=1445657 RepID=A0A2K1DXS8_9FLAO|nr:SDR family oxidoreductase [Hanstruepera neustonica]PNQ72831.1 oxidoreductase [Hanstruepera neustonica]
MKSYIIVGGSHGIGNALLESLVKDHHVINISRTEPSISHNNLTHHTVDVLTDDLPDVDTCDGLVYCPGSINLKPFESLSPQDFRDDFDINVVGAIKTIQKYLPKLKSSTNPAIVLFSTVATKLGMPYHTSVAAAKSAVEGLTKSLGAELAPKIRVNAIAPTITNTDLASKLLRNDKMVEKITERHPLKKFLEPTEVSEMALFLLSEKAASMSGQVFEMDCGIVSFKI